MALEFIYGQEPDHPITEIRYQTVLDVKKFGEISLTIEALENVESSIDLVFSWLDRHGHSNHQIEHLAPYFGSIWPSSLALAEWVSQENSKRNLVCKSLLEIGCGLAIPGLLASVLGADVTVSDGHPDVPRFLRKNLMLNSISRLKIAMSPWETGLEEVESLHQKFDYVIASDILYEGYHAEFFTKVINSVVKPEGKVVVTDPGRAYLQRFVNKMEELKWTATIFPWTVRHHGKDNDIFLVDFVRN
jgi:predicted nicotinamide N-methyase